MQANYELVGEQFTMQMKVIFAGIRAEDEVSTRQDIVGREVGNDKELKVLVANQAFVDVVSLMQPNVDIWADRGDMFTKQWMAQTFSSHSSGVSNLEICGYELILCMTR